MSLAVVIDIGRDDATPRVTAAVGLLMTGALLLAALEQSWDGNGGRAWLPLGCAAACAAWCLFLWRRPRRHQALRLQVTAAGSPRLLWISSGETADAAVLQAWILGGLVVLRVAAQSSSCPEAAAADGVRSPPVLGSANCLFVLARGSFDENRWHALRRWLVWYGRSARHEPVAA